VTSTFLHQQAGGASLEGDDDSDVDADELKSFRRAEVQKLFNIVDVDGSGVIDKDEMAHLLQSLGLTLSVEEIDVGFAKLDKDSDGAVDFDEFYQWYEDVAAGGVRGSL
jgi:Ca2+-binding EF-hand superfamily protein